MFVHVCGVPAKEVTDGNRARWPLGTVVKYFEDLSFTGLSRAQVAAAYDRACAQWSAVCDLQFQRVFDVRQANILAQDGEIDGPYSILAQSELPYAATATSCMNQVFDQSEPWDGEGIDLLVACMCHEIGHAIGLEHLPRSGGLMEPIIIPGRVAPQSADIAEAQARYGPPRATTTGTDFRALGATLAPYVLGPMCDGLVAAATKLEAGSPPSEADEALEAREASLRKTCFAAIVGPQILKLNPKDKARAYRELAAGLATRIG